MFAVEGDVLEEFVEYQPGIFIVHDGFYQQVLPLKDERWTRD